MRLTKMLSLAFVAVVAMTAMAASTATAAQFFHNAEAEAGEETARVVATNEGVHKFTAGIIGTIECKKATFTGTTFVKSPQNTVTVAPAYSECTFLKVAGVVVNMNGCTYTFNQPTGTGPFTGTTTVNCPVGKKISFEANGCKIEVGAQGPLSSVTYTNQAATETLPSSVKVAANVSKIKYTAAGTCIVLGEKADGTYSGTAISEAETPAGIRVGGSVK